MVFVANLGIIVQYTWSCTSTERLHLSLVK